MVLPVFILGSGRKSLLRPKLPCATSGLMMCATHFACSCASEYTKLYASCSIGSLVGQQLGQPRCGKLETVFFSILPARFFPLPVCTSANSSSNVSFGVAAIPPSTSGCADSTDEAKNRHINHFFKHPLFQ